MRSPNTAGTYGGVIFTYGLGCTVTVDISNSTFTAGDTTDAGTITATRNSSKYGGVMYMGARLAGTVNLTISDSTIEYGNATAQAGGMFLRSIDSTTITGSTFANNSSASAGFLQYDLNTSSHSITFTDSIIRDNFSTGINNGGLYMIGGSISFDKCFITGNSAPNRGGVGYISASTAYTQLSRRFKTVLLAAIKQPIIKAVRSGL